jgi:CheY-like chemotaxis protein/predicted regulator of Ras-like GTPase activity (Roadblock/LC7/MglB family)
MTEKWILLVDDEESILAVMIGSLNKLGQEYHVVTVLDGQAALERFKQRRFDLVVTDYKMPVMNGLQLLEQIHLVRAETPVILITAYPNSKIEAEAASLNAFRYLTKPLKMDSFLQIVKEAVGTSVLNPDGLLSLGEDDYRKLNLILHQLENDVSARCVFLTDGEGRTITRSGLYEKLPISRIASLLSGSIATLAEAGRTIGDNDTVINLAYCEGKSDNLYAINIGSQFLLILIIDRGPSSSRLGLVWYYAHNAATALLEVLNNAKYSNPGNMLGEDFEKVMDGEFDELFHEDRGADDSKKEAAATVKPENQAKITKAGKPTLLSLDDAKQAGIIPQFPGDDRFSDPFEENKKP